MSPSGDRPAIGQASVTLVRSQPWWKRGGRKLFATVIAAGALVGAITTVLTFRLPHDVEDAAAFTGITVVEGVPFSEYKQSLVAPHPPAQGLGALTVVARAQAQPTPEVSASTETAAPPDGTTTTGTVEPPATTGAPQPGDDQVVPLFGPTTTSPHTPAATVAMETPRMGVARSAMLRVHREVQAACSERLDPRFCDTTMRAITELDMANGNNADEAVARQVAMVKNLRTTRPSRGAKPEPVGAVVTAGVDLRGLRGRPVHLTWSLWEKNKDTQLYRQWLNDRLAYRMTASSDHDTASLDFWIPLPDSRGSFVVRSRLVSGESTLADVASRSFH
ncbi:hypothetical protein [Actinoplanes sp. NPDC049316]|uniref:hypothetical protein n=1 Tax=Actinoplanes sp. NPDC049316 TaxID=3154727 RepID=UPI00343DAD62